MSQNSVHKEKELLKRGIYISHNDVPEDWNFNCRQHAQETEHLLYSYKLVSACHMYHTLHILHLNNRHLNIYSRKDLALSYCLHDV